MEERRFTLKVGEEAVLRGGIWFGRDTVAYAGMVNDSVYSLAFTRTRGYNSLAYNLYLPLDRASLVVAGGAIDQVQATPEGVTFRYLR